MFSIFDNTKNNKYLCCFAKMAFNKSHFGMCMVTKGHFNIIKFFPEGKPGERQGHGGKQLPSLLPPCSNSARVNEIYYRKMTRTARNTFLFYATV